MVPVKEWSSRKRAIVSAIVSIQLAAVVLAPLQYNTRALLFQDLNRPLIVYEELAYIFHGYRFFAPNPGWSPSIHFKATTAEGRVVEGKIPDHDEHRPELLYHRHMLLAEWLIYWPANSAETQAFAEAFARHLLAKHDAASVELTVKYQRQPTYQELSSGLSVRDPSLVNEHFTLKFPRVAP